MRNIACIAKAVMLLILVGCRRVPELPKISIDSLSDDHRASLESVERVSEFPFLSMDYYGDADESHLKLIREAIGIKSNACTTFTSYNGTNEALLSRNHDWPESPVLILSSHPKNGFSSISLVDLSLLGYTKDSSFASPEDRLNLLYSVFIPMDGMNEMGVAIGAMGCMGLDSENDDPTVFSTEIIRLILDHARDVNDAIAIFKSHGIHNIIIPLHYLVSDSTGASAIIEYVDGYVQVQELGTDCKALTNFRYFGSMDDIHEKTEEYLSAGRVSKDVFGESYRRYILIRQRQASSNGIINESESMKLLRDVSMKEKTLYGDFFTVWSVVYNLSAKTADISIGREYGRTYRYQLVE